LLRSPSKLTQIEALENRLLLSASPAVTAFAIDDLPISRTAAPRVFSRALSISITFDSDVSAGLDASDLTIRNLTTKQNVAAPTLTFVYDATTFTGRWTFPNVAGSIGGSLVDGRYLATLSSLGVSGTGSLLDGDGNGVAGGNFIFGFSRFFGDSTGNGTVDTTDKTAFTATLGKSLGDPAFDARFDYNADNTIDATDQTAFNARYGKTLAATPPATPTGLTALAVSSTTINVGWRTGAGDNSAFRLERATASTGPFTTIGTFNAAIDGFRDSGRTAGKTYWYRLVATSPFGTSSASGSVSTIASLAPKLTVSTTSLLMTDAAGDGFAGDAKTIKLTNSGTGGLVIQPSGFVFTGANPDQFTADTPSVPILLGPGQSVSLHVRMNASVIGESSGALRIASNDSTGSVKQVSLRGLGFDKATQGPTLQQILDFQRIPMTITPTPGVSGTLINERAMPLLTKAGTGSVTIQVIGVAAQGIGAAQVLNAGWYTPQAQPGTTQTFWPLYSIPAGRFSGSTWTGRTCRTAGPTPKTRSTPSSRC
jgi:hypothetical protein